MTARASLVSGRRALVACLTVVAAGLALGGCRGDKPVQVNDKPNTQYITRGRVWAPGERAALIARIARTRQLVLPYVGDMSDNADQMLPTDSVFEIVDNPDYVPPPAPLPFGPAFSVQGTRVPGNGWTTFGLDLHIVNTQQSNDTYDWLGAIWFSDADSTWKGMVLAASSAGTIGATTVNTVAFDAANAKSGAGAGEIRASNGTYWEARGTGSPNQFSVALPLFFGGTNTVTSGPYTGGTTRSGYLYINVNNVGMTRQLGSGTPTNVTASVSGFVGSVQISCVFPSPCTTNGPSLAAAAARGRLPDSLYARLPWIQALPAAARARALRVR